MTSPVTEIDLQAPHSVFLSDVHLDPQSPEISAQLFNFLTALPTSTERLYIVGDLFEAWIGDDAPGEIGERVIATLATLAERGIELFFTHGNRDFLIGESFAERARCTLLNEATLIDCYGTKVLLMHGDSLCTDDIEYQQLRSMVRNPQWQASILAMEIPQRLALAQQMRASSAAQMQHKSEEIMDVNSTAVLHALEEFGVNVLLHGHTHRPAIHNLSDHQAVSALETKWRIVLGDWYTQGSVVYWSEQGFTLTQLAR